MAAKSFVKLRCDMKNESQNALVRVKSPLIDEANKIPANECDDCNENNSVSERTGSEESYLCPSCWAAAHTTVKFALES